MQRYSYKPQLGITLLEILLVMVIGASIIVLSLQQYLSYRRDADVFQLQANVDLLFQTLEKYFRANCATANFNVKNPLVYVPVTLESLMNEGYLTLSNNRMQVNPLIDSESTGQGYILQFNQINDTLGNLPVRTQPNGDAKSLGSITIWQAQVAVKLNNSQLIPQYKNILGADCTSNFVSGWGYVLPCTEVAAGSTSGDYIVFTKLPSYPSSRANNNYWATTPTVKQFRQMYTTDPILNLLSGYQSGTQYYTCGS
ncbi:MAG: type II secretion system protein [Gammaproteobacteria bacterium]|nr:type II secretion system protein [Gammaproteobacteria bacterium]